MFCKYKSRERWPRASQVARNWWFIFHLCHLMWKKICMTTLMSTSLAVCTSVVMYPFQKVTKCSSQWSMSIWKQNLGNLCTVIIRLYALQLYQKFIIIDQHCSSYQVLLLKFNKELCILYYLYIQHTKLPQEPIFALEQCKARTTPLVSVGIVSVFRGLNSNCPALSFCHSNLLCWALA